MLSNGQTNKNYTLRAGFEPARVEPNGFQVHRLNHSAIAAVHIWSLFVGIYKVVILSAQENIV